MDYNKSLDHQPPCFQASLTEGQPSVTKSLSAALKPYLQFDIFRAQNFGPLKFKLDLLILNSKVLTGSEKFWIDPKNFWASAIPAGN